jgi:hypothetical protein
MTTSMSYLWDPSAILLSGRVDRLTADEECWYRRALDYSWIDEGLSADAKEAADRIKKGCTPEAAIKILGLFFILDKHGKMVNEKQEELRKKLKKKIRNLSENGKRSGQKRRQKRDLASEQMPNNCSTDAEPMSGKISNVINKETKEEERREETPQAASPKRGSRLPEPFMVKKEMQEWADAECPQLDLKTETQKFVNYWRAKTGKDATKLDWPATWENWMLNARDKYGSNKQSNGNGRQSAGTTIKNRWYRQADPSGEANSDG